MNAYLQRRFRSWLRRVLLGGQEDGWSVLDVPAVSGAGAPPSCFDPGLGARGGDDWDRLGAAAADPPRGTGRIDPPLAIPIDRIRDRYSALEAAIAAADIPRDVALVLAMRTLTNTIIEEGLENNFALDRCGKTDGKVH